MKKTWHCFKIVIIILLLLTAAAMVLSLVVKRDTSPGKPAAEQYTVTFDVGEYGKPLSSVTVNFGDVPVLPVPDCKFYSAGIDYSSGEPVTLDDYAFNGWYLDGEPVSEDNIVAFDRDVTLVAEWRSLWIGPY